MAKRIIPLLNRVVVQRVELPKRSVSGIYLPEAAAGDTQLGLVVAAGQGQAFDNGKSRETAVKEGQHVLLPSYPGQEIEIDGQKLYIYRDTEVLGTLHS